MTLAVEGPRRGGWNAEGNVILGFFERQKNLYRRYWLWEVVWMSYNLINVLAIGYLASGLSALGVTGVRVDVRGAQLYLLLGSLLWGYLSQCFFEVAFAITWERWEGTIEFTFMAPVRRLTHLLGICLFGVVYALARSIPVVLVVALAFHLDLSHADLAAALVVFLAGTVPLVGLGIFTSILPLLSPEKGEQMTIAAEGFLLLVSGVYYPLTVLPTPLRLIGQASPLTYCLAGIRGAMLQHRGIPELLPSIALLVAMGAVLIPTGLWVFARAEARAKRLGLLKRSG
jgi:ABC-2 type transport system permease protein